MSDPDIPTEALEAAARAIYNLERMAGIDWWEGAVSEAKRRESKAIEVQSYRTKASAVIAAAAPHLIAEGRRQAAEAIRAVVAADPDENTVLRWQKAFEWAAKVAEGAE